MAFCEFEADTRLSHSTNIDNYFLTEYLPEANGDAVKVYLYGLYLCENSNKDMDLKEFSKNLYLEEDYVKELFRYWEDYDVVKIITDEPFSVKFLAISNLGKPRKFKSGKYDDFNKSLQNILKDRMISPNEYVDYFSFMEDYDVSPEAMLMIAKYCSEVKTPAIGAKYVLTVARNFADRGIRTPQALETELSDYNAVSDSTQKLLSAMGSKRKAEVDEANLFNKWTKSLEYSPETLIYVVKTQKIKNFAKLDRVIEELYGAKAFTKAEIDDYFARKDQLNNLARDVARQLSVYVEVLSPVIENYINPWLTLGFDADTLKFIANYCFKRRKHTFEAMDDTVNSLYKKGLVSLNSIADYLKNRAAEDAFIKTLLDITATDRLPNEFDRKCVANWREWGFNDEMITLAAGFAQGKMQPIIYMNNVLSNWKTIGAFTPDKVPARKPNTAVAGGSQHTKNERTYTKEQLDALLTDIEDLNF